MDVISVTDEALQSACVTLQLLAEASEKLTEQCTATINDQLTGLDEDFRRTVAAHAEMLKALDVKLKRCIDENIVCLRDRLMKISEYEQEYYRKQTYR